MSGKFFKKIGKPWFLQNLFVETEPSSKIHTFATKNTVLIKITFDHFFDLKVLSEFECI